MPHHTHRRARCTATLLALACSLGLAGCVAGAEPAPPSITQANGYVEPAWMAETRQRTADEMAVAAACMRQDGWTVIIKPDQSIAPGEKLTPEQFDAWFDAFVACGDANWDFQEASRATYEMLYAHMLDTRACLIAAGYRVPEPPSAEAWVDAGMRREEQWAPFLHVLGQTSAAGVPWTMESYNALYQQCPQDGPVVGYSG